MLFSGKDGIECFFDFVPCRNSGPGMTSTLARNRLPVVSVERPLGGI